MSGGNIGLGALTGAITAGAFLGAGSIINSMGLLSTVGGPSMGQIMGASAIHFVAGAASGAVDAAITGGNAGTGAIESGVSAGVAEGVGVGLGLLPDESGGWLSNLQPVDKFIAGLGVTTTLGSLAGGVTAELEGGNFGQGMAQGVWTAAYGFIFNSTVHGMALFIQNGRIIYYVSGYTYFLRGDYHKALFYGLFLMQITSNPEGVLMTASSYYCLGNREAFDKLFKKLEADSRISDRLPWIIRNLKKKCGGQVRP